MRSLLEYFKIENISHPAPSDVELRMDLSPKISKMISECVGKIFEGECVTFKCHNSIDSELYVESDHKIYQLIIGENRIKFSYKGVNEDHISSILESNSDKEIREWLSNETDKLCQEINKI